MDVDEGVQVDEGAVVTALRLAGRVAQHGRVMFEDDPRARVAWQADTRLRYLDEMPAVRQRHATRLRQLARLGHEGSASEHG